MKLLLKKGAASQTALVFIQDSTSTTGAGKTGLLYTTSGLTWYYYREAQGTGGTQVTLADMTLGTWASGGFKEVDATDMPGWYEIGIPNAALVTGADFVGMTLRGATGMADCALEVQLTDADLNDATALGLSRLDAAMTSRHASGAAVASVSGSVGSVSGNVGGSVASVTGAVGSVTGAVGSVAGAVGSVTAGVTLANDAVSAAALKTDAVAEIVNAVAALDLAAGSVDYEAIMATSPALGAMLAACRAVLVGHMDAPSATSKKWYSADGTAHFILQTHGSDYTTRETPTQG